MPNPIRLRASQMIEVDVLVPAACAFAGHYGVATDGLDRTITSEGKGICVSYTGEGSERGNCESGDKKLVHVSLHQV
jgi:hypothetical protein